MSMLGTIVSNMAEVEKSRIGLRSLEVQLAHDREMYALKTDFLRDLIHSLIDRRIDAVERSFNLTMGMYAEQARHYMAQQDKYAEAEIKATAPRESANIRVRLSEIDLQLTQIRSDAAALYREMMKVIIIIGGSIPPMSHADQHALAIAGKK
jgi:hypothetical protein